MKTHDYTIRTWGHDFTFDPIDGGLRGTMMGWGKGIEQGDYIIVPNRERTTRYRIRKITYQFDPSDMWSANVEFAPRS